MMSTEVTKEAAPISNSTGKNPGVRESGTEIAAYPPRVDSKPQEEQRSRYVDAFWGSGDEGFKVLCDHSSREKGALLDIISFIKARAALEEEYGKKLFKISNLLPVRGDYVRLSNLIRRLREETKVIAENQMETSNKMFKALEKPLRDLTLMQSIIRKNQIVLCERNFKARALSIKELEKIKARKQKKSEFLLRIKAQLDRDPPPDDKTTPKLLAKIDKHEKEIKLLEESFSVNADIFKTINDKWIDYFRNMCSEFQRHDEQRYNAIKVCLYNYSNIFSGLCKAKDQSNQSIRDLLPKCDLALDIEDFVEKHKTGTTVPDSDEYRNISRRTTTEIDDTLSLMLADKAEISEPNNRVDNESHIITPISDSCSPNDDTAVEVHQRDESKSCAQEIINLPKLPFEAVASFSFVSRNKMELSLNKGAKIKVTSVYDEDWWEGQITEEDGTVKRGFFPKNHVTLPV